MFHSVSRPVLGDYFSADVDTIGEESWSEVCRDFADANIYQMWPYEAVRSGRHNVSRLLLRQRSDVVAAVQARIVRIPHLSVGMAYVRWGPLWRKRSGSVDLGVFRQAVRALRNEYVNRRRLVVRITSQLFNVEDEACRRILEEEGYVRQHRARADRTIVMDISPPTERLYQGVHQKWRYHLNKGRRQNLELIEGQDENYFQDFERIYFEMLNRKQFCSLADLGQSRRIQNELRPAEKMRVVLCKVEGAVCAGGICSAIGDTGLYLFGATSNRGTKTYASYLVHWSMLEWAKRCGCRSYDLNGINPDKNPGGYQFKSQLAGAHGREIDFLGQFDAYPNAALRHLVRFADSLRERLRNRRENLASSS